MPSCLNCESSWHTLATSCSYHPQMFEVTCFVSLLIIRSYILWSTTPDMIVVQASEVKVIRDNSGEIEPQVVSFDPTPAQFFAELSAAAETNSFPCKTWPWAKPTRRILRIPRRTPFLWWCSGLAVMASPSSLRFRWKLPPVPGLWQNSRHMQLQFCK